MELRPDAIASRRFPRALLGVNVAEVRRFLLQGAAALERANSELARAIADRAHLQATLRQTRDDLNALRGQLAEAREKLSAYHAQEAAMARALLTAQKAADDLIKANQARAEQLLAEADAAAQETTHSAHRAAAELLRTTRVRAQQAIDAADRAAEARIAEAQFETGRLVDEARRESQEAQHQVQQFISELETLLATREKLSTHLDALSQTYTDSLAAIGRVHTEVVDTILPSLRHLMDALSKKGEPAPGPAGPPLSAPALRGPAAPAPDAAIAGSAVTPSVPGAAPPLPAPTPDLPAPAAAPAGPRDLAARNGRHASSGTPQPAGEVIVSPVHSYLQATKLVIEVSHLKGVKAARLRSFSKGSITIDVVAEAGAFAAVDPRLINGFPLSVVEATDRRLVLSVLPNGGPGAPDAEEISS